MKWIGLVSMGLFLIAQAAAAGPTWSSIDVAVTPQNAAKVVAATDKLMNSTVGKQFPGLLLLQVQMANGSNPATHSFVPLYKSAADREAYAQKMMADPAWTEFEATMTQLSQPVSNVMFRTLKSWGEVVDTDHLWMTHAFDVRDAPGVLGALGKLMASETGKKFPGQVHLEGVIAGGITSMTHAIIVGYASEAEMETWGDSLAGNADWAAYIEALNASAEYLGTSMILDVKTWGSLSLKDLAVP
jgi:hypothetical protein